MKAPANAAGRRVKCPKCAAVLTVPTPVVASERPTEDELGYSDEGESLLEDLAAAERSAAALARPNLAATVGASSAAGFAPRGSAAASAPRISAGDVAGAAGAALGGLGRLAGPFVLGCVLSAVAAVISAVVWTVVAIATEREWGLIAWGVGGLTGFGMALGLRRVSLLAGVVAAGLSLASIVVAKFTIFMFVLYSVVAAVTGEEAGDGDRSAQQAGRRPGEAVVDPVLVSRRIYVARWLAEEILDEWNVTNAHERKRESSAAWNEAIYRVKHMSDEELLAKFEEYKAKDPDWIEEEADYDAESANEAESGESADESGDVEYAAEQWEHDDSDEAYYDGSEEDSSREFVGAFVRAVFHPLDALFILLAVATAFRVGSQGLQGV